MLNFGFGEILIVMVLALIFVGPERLPHMIRWLGRQYGKLLRASDELRRAFVLEADRMDAEKRTSELRRRREEARGRAEDARRAREAGEDQPDGQPTLPDDAATRPEAPTAEAETADATPVDAPHAHDLPVEEGKPA